MTGLKRGYFGKAKTSTQASKKIGNTFCDLVCLLNKLEVAF